MINIFDNISFEKRRSITRFLNTNGKGGTIGAGYIYKNPGIYTFDSTLYSMSYIIEGTGRHILNDGREWPIATGSIFHRLPNIEHRAEVLTPWKECYIDSDFFVYNQLKQCGFFNFDEPVGQAEFSLSLVETILNFIDRLDHASGAALLRLFTEWQNIYLDALERVKAFQKNNNKNQLSIERICHEIQESISSGPPLPTLCATNGWGYEKTRKLFKEAMGISLGNYRIKKRLEKAAIYLTTTNETISFIAEYLGYKDPFEFSKQFHKFMGVSPGKFRNR